MCYPTCYTIIEIFIIFRSYAVASRLNGDMKPIQEYWESIQKPTYDPRKSVQENLTDLKNFMGYWPEPLNCDKIVQTALLEYEEDTPFVDMFKKQAAFELQQKEGDTKRVFRKKDWEDDVPF